MRKLVIFIVAIYASVTSFSASAQQHFISFHNESYSVAPLIFQIPGMFDIGPLQPGETIRLSKEQYDLLKGHKIQPRFVTTNYRVRFSCPSALVRYTIEYKANYTKGSMGCGYTQHGLQGQLYAHAYKQIAN